VSISGSYIWQLRTGKKDNPTKRHIEALASFFGVPAAYFFDDGEAERIDAELKLVSAAMRDSSVRSVALRSAGLSKASLDVISSMIEQFRRWTARRTTMRRRARRDGHREAQQSID
jgi:transcriptional regulator with XRE-family HTH domain